MQIIRMEKEFEKTLRLKILVEIMICMFKAIILLADIFENFRDMYVEIYELDPSRFFTAPGLARQTT